MVDIGGDSLYEVRPTKKQKPKRLTWDDVPPKVLRAIFSKWEMILQRRTWTDDCWSVCSLCHFVRQNCEICPAGRGSWCKGYGESSRLSIFHYRHHRRQSSWLKAVGAFVAMMRDIISRREKI